jgi:hypothetical protein
LLLSVSSANRWETPFDALFFLFSFLLYMYTHTHALCVYNPPSSLFLFLLVCDAIRIVYTIGIVIRQSPLRLFPFLVFF